MQLNPLTISFLPRFTSFLLLSWQLNVPMTSLFLAVVIVVVFVTGHWTGAHDDSEQLHHGAQQRRSDGCGVSKSSFATHRLSLYSLSRVVKRTKRLCSYCVDVFFIILSIAGWTRCVKCALDVHSQWLKSSFEISFSTRTTAIKVRTPTVAKLLLMIATTGNVYTVYRVLS